MESQDIHHSHSKLEKAIDTSIPSCQACPEILIGSPEPVNEMRENKQGRKNGLELRESQVVCRLDVASGVGRLCSNPS